MLPALDKSKRYTYADYCSWGEDVRCELIDGVVYDMSPAPTSAHQRISGNLFAQLYVFLQGKPCKVFYAPFDVRLDPGAGDDSVVQPDILVICDMSKITDSGCDGAPDMVVEILSPSTASKDMLLKHRKYLQACVREYWVVDPQLKIVRVHVLKDGRYDYIDYLETSRVPVRTLDGCEIDIQKVFAD